jgi:hypothetical protein
MINYVKDIWMVKFEADIKLPRESVEAAYILQPFQCELGTTVTFMDEEDASLSSLGQTTIH